MKSIELLNHEVQLKLGRCMIRLQQYERGLKGMVATSALEGPGEQLQAVRARQVDGVRSKTLGQLVGMFAGNYLTSASSNVETGQGEEAVGGGQAADVAWAGMRFNILMSPECYAEIKAGLAELVALRNDLVHHFIERFDLSDEIACRAASLHLDRCNEEIDRHCKHMKGWAESVLEIQAQAASYLESKAFTDVFVHGKSKVRPCLIETRPERVQQ